MATGLTFMGDCQEDDGEKWAKLTLHLNNFKKSAGDIMVSYPNDVRRPLVVRVGDTEIYKRLLPAAIVAEESTYMTKFGKIGKIVIRLRKSELRRWGDRWSPKHAQGPPSWECTAEAEQGRPFILSSNVGGEDRETSSPVVTFPDEEDD